MYYTGETFEIRLKVEGDLEELTTYIRFKKPNGVEFQYPPDSIDGQYLVYETWAEDFDIPGFWYVQGFATDDDNIQYFGEIKLIEIKSPL
jgi:hypothetical protein